jgi:diguanylate cyclase (GGDEF)-like protein/PAS domain S-box-containing protein
LSLPTRLALAHDEIERLRAELGAIQDHHRNTIELSPVVTWTASPRGEVDDASPTWFAMVGLSREQALGYGWTQAVHPDDLPAAFEQWAVCLPTGRALDVEYRWRLLEGNYHWFRARAQPVRDAEGRIIRWYGTSENIHERKLASAALQESENRLRHALESGRLGTWELDIESGRLTASDQFAANFGLTSGADIADYTMVLAAMHPQDRASHDAVVGEFLTTGNMLETRFRVFWPDGSEHWVRVTGRMITDEGGRPVRAIGTSLDITESQHADEERRRAEQRLVHLANHDPLTDLANHRLLRAELARAIEAATATVAYIHIDLNDFKAINDALGHGAGDALLLQVAERLTASSRPGDLVGRTLGGAFAVLAMALPSRASVRAYAEQLLDVIAQPTYVGDRRIAISASIGIAWAPEDAICPDQLRRNAGTALSRSKALGHGRVQFFEPEMDTRQQAREALKLELRTAISGQELQLYFQPIVDLTTGRIISFEALMRWRHPSKGMVSPADFIPLAEETGWIAEFGRWALLTACREAARWPAPIGVSVNISIVQFGSGGLEADVADALAISGLPPDRLELEVTESLVLRDTAENIATLHALRRMGVRIVMDDFGAGFSSLSSLRSFNFDKIKLDKSLLEDVPDDGDGDAIVQSVIGLAHGLGLPVTAEGVETPLQLALLRARGYHYAQGYYFSVPVAGDDVPRLLGRSWPV